MLWWYNALISANFVFQQKITIYIFTDKRLLTLGEWRIANYDSTCFTTSTVRIVFVRRQAEPRRYLFTQPKKSHSRWRRTCIRNVYPLLLNATTLYVTFAKSPVNFLTTIPTSSHRSLTTAILKNLPSTKRRWQ